MLDTYRQRIDAIDQDIVALLKARYHVTRDVGIYKQQHQLPVLQQEREAQLLQHIAKDLAADEQWIIDIYKVILDASRQQQQAIQNNPSHE